MKNKNIGVCAICGLTKKLTFEHYPPKAAFNENPVLIKDHRHINPAEAHLYGKSMRSNRGMGGYKLCATCNNNTGTWYAKEYIDVVTKSSPIIANAHDSQRVQFSIQLKPLNFLKQVLTFHLCADKATGIVRKYVSENNFILDKSAKDLSEKIKIYMYATNSVTHRFMGISTVFTGDINNIGSYSEFNFHPFGFLLALDSPPPEQLMKDITYFKEFDFNQNENIEFSLPILSTNRGMIGTY